MSRMYIKYMRVTKDESSIKVAYEKDGRFYVRSGKDGFSRGVPIKGEGTSTLATWGFRTVNRAPYFYDGEEIKQNISRFSMNRDGTVDYND